MAFLTFLPFLLTEKGASLPTIGLALSLAFAGGAVGKPACAFIGARIGVVATVFLTEALTTVATLALLPLPLDAVLLLLPAIGVALNGTSSVLYGSVPVLVSTERRARAFGLFYTGTIGSGAAGPKLLTRRSLSKLGIGQAAPCSAISSSRRNAPLQSHLLHATRIVSRSSSARR
jgi:MFS family permease